MKKSTYDKLRTIGSAIINEFGREVNNPEPVALDFSQPNETTDSRILRILQGELSKKAAELEKETLEESEDFDIEGDFDLREPLSHYQIMDPEFPNEVARELGVDPADQGKGVAEITSSAASEEADIPGRESKDDPEGDSPHQKGESPPNESEGLDA